MTGGIFRFITTIMPNYNYTARDNAGKIAKGTIEAENELEWQNEMVGNIRLERSVAKARDSVNRGEKISTP